MGDEEIRGVLDRLLVAAGPRRLSFLAHLPTSRIREVIDELELREAGLKRAAEPLPAYGEEDPSYPYEPR